MTQHEQEMVRRFQSGAPGSFDALYAEFGDRVYRFCRRLLTTPADAEDLTQDVFVAAFEGRERFRGRSSIQTWLFRIAVFRYRAGKRRRSVETTSLSVDERAMPSSADLADTGLVRIDLARALRELPDDQRAAFLLVRAEGLTCREAAEVLGIPEGTLKFRVYRAAEKLQSLLALPGGSSASSIAIQGKVSGI